MKTLKHSLPPSAVTTIKYIGWADELIRDLAGLHNQPDGHVIRMQTGKNIKHVRIVIMPPDVLVPFRERLCT